jgi:hypothetical protein
MMAMHYLSMVFYPLPEGVKMEDTEALKKIYGNYIFKRYAISNFFSCYGVIYLSISRYFTFSIFKMEKLDCL